MRQCWSTWCSAIFIACHWGKHDRGLEISRLQNKGYMHNHCSYLQLQRLSLYALFNWQYSTSRGLVRYVCCLYSYQSTTTSRPQRNASCTYATTHFIAQFETSIMLLQVHMKHVRIRSLGNKCILFIDIHSNKCYFAIIKQVIQKKTHCRKREAGNINAPSCVLLWGR